MPPSPPLQLAASAALQPMGGGPIHDAAINGNKAEVKRLLDSGTDINSQDGVRLNLVVVCACVCARVLRVGGHIGQCESMCVLGCGGIV